MGSPTRRLKKYGTICAAGEAGAIFQPEAVAASGRRRHRRRPLDGREVNAQAGPAEQRPVHPTPQPRAGQSRGGEGAPKAGGARLLACTPFSQVTGKREPAGEGQAGGGGGGGWRWRRRVPTDQRARGDHRRAGVVTSARRGPPCAWPSLSSPPPPQPRLGRPPGTLASLCPQHSATALPTGQRSALHRPSPATELCDHGGDHSASGSL